MSTWAQPGRLRRPGRGLKTEEKSANSQFSKPPHTQNFVSVWRSHIDFAGKPQSLAVSGFQRCGSNSSTRLAGWVGSRCSTSLR